jgi:hypothetical protein
VCAIKCPSHCVYELGRRESVDLYMFEIFSADEDDRKTVVEIWYNHRSCGVSVAPAKTNAVQSHSRTSKEHEKYVQAKLD